MTDTTAPNFVLINTRTGIPFAAFALPRDALHYVKLRRELEGPNGPHYRIVNTGRVPVQTTLLAQIHAVNDAAARSGSLGR